MFQGVEDDGPVVPGQPLAGFGAHDGQRLELGACQTPQRAFEVGRHHADAPPGGGGQRHAVAGAAARVQDRRAGVLAEHRVRRHVLDGHLGDVPCGLGAGRAVLTDVREEVDEVLRVSRVPLDAQSAFGPVDDLHVAHVGADDGEGLAEHGGQDLAPVAASDTAVACLLEAERRHRVPCPAGKPQGAQAVRTRHAHKTQNELRIIRRTKRLLRTIA